MQSHISNSCWFFQVDISRQCSHQQNTTHLSTCKAKVPKAIQHRDKQRKLQEKEQDRGQRSFPEPAGNLVSKGHNSVKEAKKGEVTSMLASTADPSKYHSAKCRGSLHREYSCSVLHGRSCLCSEILSYWQVHSIADRVCRRCKKQYCFISSY